MTAQRLPSRVAPRVALVTWVALACGSVLPASAHAGQDPAAAAAQASSASASPERRKPGLILGPGDIVTVSVLGRPEMTTTLDVDGDGHISVPLVGRVAVAGQSTSSAAAKVAAAL